MPTANTIHDAHTTLQLRSLDRLLIIGPPAAQVLPSVAPDHVRAAVRAMLTEIDVCATEGEAADEILALLRSMRALETGAPTTKTDGVRWGRAASGGTLAPVDPPSRRRPSRRAGGCR